MDNQIAVIPRPAHLERLTGHLTLPEQLTVHSEPGTDRAAALLRTWLEQAGHRLDGGDPVIALTRAEPGALAAEGYELLVDRGRVTVRAADPAGALHAVQTLRQLTPPDSFGARGCWRLPCVRVADRPRFRWRGAMLDVGRRFLPVEDVLRYLDLLALHKFNVLHLHLTEDAGWRVEIERYPLLTEIGAWRRGTALPAPIGASTGHDSVPHGGYYTKAQLRDIVRYAAARGIEVVPEIEMPGHTQAAIAAYPGLGNLTERLDVATLWGISRHVLNVRPETIWFFRDVLEEIVDVFPGRYVHLGGDECPTEEWKANPDAQQRVRSAGLAGEHELPGWFAGQVARALDRHGRRAIGWDELTDGTLPGGLTVMSWRGIEGGVRAARQGHDVIMAPRRSTYFDYYQSADTGAEPLAFDEVLTLEQVFAFDPVPEGLAAEDADRILGTQFQIWCEHIDGGAAVDYMTFPRACALAEVAWSTERGSWPEFRGRLAGHLGRLDRAGVGYRRLDG